MSWLDLPLVGFDTETTGTDTATARLVTAAIIVRADGEDSAHTWLADPGVEIPPPAAAVHGITTEFARAHGRPCAEVLEEVASLLAEHMRLGHPVVAFNAGYDFQIMEAELARHSLPTLRQRVGDLRPVLDPLVLDRHVDRFRRGKRTLTEVAKVYGVTAAGDAHNADIDVLMALDVAQVIGTRYQQLTALDPQELHDLQVSAYRVWAEDFIDWRRRKGNASFIMPTRWLG